MSESKCGARVVLITAPDDALARNLARILVGERLLACANVVPGVTSVYRWQGRVEEATEALIIGKTSSECLARLEARVLDIHPYDVPEFVALEPAHVERRYLDWLLAQTRVDQASEGGL